MSKEKHTGVERMADKAQDMMGGMSGRISAKSAGSMMADEFVENAAIGDMYEIAAATEVLKRSRSPEVRQAARKMIADHTTNSHQLRSALRTNEARDAGKIPAALDERRRKMIEHLEAAPDDKLDATWLDQQVLAHKEAADLMTGYQDRGDNPQLRSLAAGSAPVVQRHLKRMEELKQRISA